MGIINHNIGLAIPRSNRINRNIENFIYRNNIYQPFSIQNSILLTLYRIIKNKKPAESLLQIAWKGNFKQNLYRLSRVYTNCSIRLRFQAKNRINKKIIINSIIGNH